jgi:hypothetical protein
MYKTRTGSVIDYGNSYPLGTYSGDAKYLINMGQTCPIESGPTLLNFYENANQNLFRAPLYGFLGTETFWSTNNRSPVWNECTHTKQNASFTYPWGTIDKHLHSQHVRYCERSPWATPPSNAFLGSLPNVGEVSDFTRARAWASMQPTFKSDFQTLNFIWELKDFREIVGAFSKLMSGTTAYKMIKLSKGKAPVVKALRKSIGKDFGSISAAEAMNKSANTIAGAWLLNAYAIQPTINDLVSLSSAASVMYIDALNKFKASGEKTQSSHYTEVLYDDTNFLGNNGNVPSGKVYDERRQSFTASLDYNFKYNLNPGREAFMRYWGLLGTPEEFWNMIPLSFLLDYVIKIGESLRLAQIDKNLDLSVLNYSESNLSFVRRIHYATFDPSVHCSLVVDGILAEEDKKYPVFGYVSSRYTRKLTTPLKHGLVIPNIRGISSGHLANIAALVKGILF